MVRLKNFSLILNCQRVGTLITLSRPAPTPTHPTENKINLDIISIIKINKYNVKIINIYIFIK